MHGTNAVRGVYTLVVLGATAAVAYFQALGASKLVGASLAVPILQTHASPTPPAPPRASVAPKLPPAPDPHRALPPKLVFAGAPVCAGLELKIASQAEDPLTSRATVRHVGDAPGTLLQQGNVFDDLHLIHVGYDAVGVTPVAWFLRGESVCQLRMFSGPKVPPATARVALPVEQTPPHDEIRSTGAGAFQVDRALVDRLLADPAARNDAYAAFQRAPGGTFALEMKRVRRGGWAHALGLQAGDLVRSVNGHELKDPRNAIEAYAALRMTNDLVLEVERSGKLETIRVAIR